MLGEMEVIIPSLQPDEILNPEELKSEVVSSIEFGNIHVALDFSEISYISSGIIGMLVSLQKIVSKRSGRFALIVPNERLYDILDRTGSTKVITVCRSWEDLQKEKGKPVSATGSAQEKALAQAPQQVTPKAEPRIAPKTGGSRSEFDMLKAEILGGGDEEIPVAAPKEKAAVAQDQARREMQELERRRKEEQERKERDERAAREREEREKHEKEERERREQAEKD
jgi:anti-anti-sigma factor